MTSRSRHAQLQLDIIRKGPQVPRTMSGLAKLVHDWGFTKQPQECIWVVAYDGDLNVRTVIEVARGSHAVVSLHLPTMLAAVMTTGCDRFMLIHNHPNMRIQPSHNDIDLTAQVMAAANTCGLHFEDHMVVTPDGRWLSMANEGIIDPVDYATYTRRAASNG